MLHAKQVACHSTVSLRFRHDRSLPSSTIIASFTFVWRSKVWFVMQSSRRTERPDPVSFIRRICLSQRLEKRLNASSAPASLLTSGCSKWRAFLMCLCDELTVMSTSPDGPGSSSISIIASASLLDSAAVIAVLCISTVNAFTAESKDSIRAFRHANGVGGAGCGSAGSDCSGSTVQFGAAPSVGAAGGAASSFDVS